MSKITSYLLTLALVVHMRHLSAFPMPTDRVKRLDSALLPNAHFSVVTDEKLLELRELAGKIQDPTLRELYDVVQHYVQLARKNGEHVLWKYDAAQEGLVLVLKQNLNGILYYG